MKTEYEERLRTALRRTDDWQLSCAGSRRFQISLAGGVDVLRPTMSDIAAMSNEHPKPVIERGGDCAGVHHLALILMLQNHWPTIPVLTIGDVRVNGRPRYGLTRQIMKQLLRAGPEATGRLDLHAWLTFPDLTILDMVLRPAMENQAGRRYDPGQADQYIIFGASHELAPELEYEPYLVGEATLHQIGAVEPENQIVFDALIQRC
jgi:hypothetical protein